MESFLLTRKEVADILLSLDGKLNRSSLEILQEAWAKNHKEQVAEGSIFKAFTSTVMPPIFEKIIKMKPKAASFSIADIVDLGKQIEYTQFRSTTAVQNWIKRDIKDLIPSPAYGKKYSIDQAALIFTVSDLKTLVDFDSLTKLLKMIFQDPHDIKNDLISPLELYSTYTRLFEELDVNNDQILDTESSNTIGKKNDSVIEVILEKNADLYAYKIEDLTNEEKEAVSNTIAICTLAVQTSYFQAISKRFINAITFSHNLKL